MAFNRQMELIIGYGNIGVQVSDLEMTFDIQRSITFSENTATFTITNANEQTRNMIAQEKNNVTFKAGYVDEGIGTLFIGQVTEASSEKNDANWITTIKASAIQSTTKPLEYTTLALSYKPGSLLSTILLEIGTTMGVFVAGAENANITLPNGLVYAGTVKGALEYCLAILKDNNKGVYIDNNEMVIYNVGVKDSRYSVVYLDFDSGLISVKKMTENTSDKKVDQEGQVESDEKRISFKTIMIPKIQPNALMQITTPSITGIYLIELLHFFGDNMGGDYGITGEAIS